MLDLENVKVLYYDKSVWHGMEYDEFNYKKVLTSYTLVPEKDFESVYASLLEHQLTTLPDQIDLLKHLDTTSSLKPEIVDRLLGTDGDWYEIEYKTGNEIRRYAFGAPEDYAYFYKQEQVFQHYVAIKNIFGRELRRKEY